MAWGTGALREQALPAARPPPTRWDVLLRSVESDMADGPGWVGVRDSSSLMPRERTELWALLPPSTRSWTHPRLDLLA